MKRTKPAKHTCPKMQTMQFSQYTVTCSAAIFNHLQKLKQNVTLPELKYQMVVFSIMSAAEQRHRVLIKKRKKTMVWCVFDCGSFSEDLIS